MTELVESLKSQMHHLSPSERVDLAAFLLQGLDPDTGDDPAWRAEVSRRVAEIRSGAVVGRPLDDVLAELKTRTR